MIGRHFCFFFCWYNFNAELRTRIMSVLCNDFEFPEMSVWALVKRYIWMQIESYQMSTFLNIGEWYEAREKTLAHVDPEVGVKLRFAHEIWQISSFVSLHFTSGRRRNEKLRGLHATNERHRQR